MLRAYERVRVEDMAGVDLGLFDFDFALTFCALILHPDGTVLHTYGGRDASGAESHLSPESFARALEAGLESFRRHRPGPTRVPRGPTVEALPAMARRIQAGQRPKCFHCHMVEDALLEERRAAGRWRLEDAFRWPDPVQVGLRLDRDDGVRVRAVVAGSAAARAGLAAGDRILDLGGRRVATFGDVQRVLEGTAGAGGRLALRLARGDAEREAALELPPGWRTPDPATFAWRPTKWRLEPEPGFGGPALTPQEKAALGLPAGRFAFRVGYLVTWGEKARAGRHAADAGLRKGDVVVEVAGRHDFESVEHFQAWVRLTRRPGDPLPLVVLREGARVEIPLTLLPAGPAR